MFVGSTAADLKIGSNRVKAVRQGANLRYFRPDSISGLKLWLDADDASTITESTGVSAWADKSGQGNNATQGTGASQPSLQAAALNGKSAVRFDGTDDRLSVSDSQGSFNYLHNGSQSHVFVVASPGESSNPNTLLGIIGNNAAASQNVGFSLYYDDRSSSSRNDTLLVSVLRGVSGTTAADLIAQSSFAPQQASVVSVAVDADNANAALRVVGNVNGRAVSDLSTGAYSVSLASASYPLQVGAAGNNITPFSGDIAEILIYDAELTTDQRQLVEGYLAHKWGLQSKLPYDHPYASSFYGVQTLPTDTDVLAFAAASGATSIPDLLKVEDLVAYLKAQSLWGYARFYPMKSAQNAGSGSTVYGLGGLTSNNMTLVNSPTWGSDGVTFNGSTQYGNVGDIFDGGDLTIFARIAFASATPTAHEAILASYDFDADKRSFIFRRSGITAGYPFEMVRASLGTFSFATAEVYKTEDHVATDSDECLVAQWLASNSRSLWQGKSQRSMTLLAGYTSQSQTYDSDQDIYFAAGNSGTPADHAELSSRCLLVIAGTSSAPTTTQREAITDLINAL